MNYYNEYDPKIARWLEALISDNLIPRGIVDTRSITEVSPSDLSGFVQCHFFAGIGGWALALQLAGWPADKPVWTGSCPCQPFSTGGLQKGFNDPRHLWPVWFKLIKECKPTAIFGEQVASKIALEWYDSLSDDLENEGYACGAADLCAASVHSPQVRQRLYWGAYSEGFDGQTHGLLEQGGVRGSQVADGGFPSIFNDGTWSFGENEGGKRMPSIVQSFDGLSPILAGYGNAIVPQVAAEFILACCDVIQ